MTILTGAAELGRRAGQGAVPARASLRSWAPTLAASSKRSGEAPSGHHGLAARRKRQLPGLVPPQLLELHQRVERDDRVAKLWRSGHHQTASSPLSTKARARGTPGSVARSPAGALGRCRGCAPKRGSGLAGIGRTLQGRRAFLPRVLRPRCEAVTARPPAGAAAAARVEGPGGSTASAAAPPAPQPPPVPPCNGLSKKENANRATRGEPFWATTCGNVHQPAEAVVAEALGQLKAPRTAQLQAVGAATGGQAEARQAHPRGKRKRWPGPQRAQQGPVGSGQPPGQAGQRSASSAAPSSSKLPAPPRRQRPEAR